MKNSLVLLFSIFLFSSCKTDQQIQQEFSGIYEVTIEAKEASEDLAKAKKDMKKEMKKARKDMEEEFAEAQKEIEEEFGEDSNFGKAIGSFVEGMGHFAEGMTELGESLGGLGIDLGSDILNNVRFNAEFQNDGKVAFGKKGRLRIQSDDLHWKIENGKMLLWDEDNGEADVQSFEMKKLSDGEWDLVGEEVVFHLRKEGGIDD